MVEALGFQVATAGDGREALEKLTSFPANVILTDLMMPCMGGIELLKELSARGDRTPTIVLTAFGSIDRAISIVHDLKAFWFLEKPVQPGVMRALLERALQQGRLLEETERLSRQLSYQGVLGEMVGDSPPMQEVFSLIRQVAPTTASVLITGESGTGKELVARAIHRLSPRSGGPFVAVNCAALPESLVESELFGHEKGAFTGAQYRKKGKFEVADGGTVFLDEISDISLKTQTDLLRVLQEKEIVRVGSNQPIKVDFRCVAATNKNLEALVKAGTFRPDLYYRLHIFCIDLPPLRDRREDIPLLVAHFLNKFCMLTSRPVPQISAEALQVLMNHEWPGNVRELENAVERALVVCRGPEIKPADFSFQFQSGGVPTGRTLDDVERVHIERVLRETDHNLSRAARILDIDRTTLYNKLKRYGLK
jgi:DNA-binding NtrC family response regulator